MYECSFLTADILCYEPLAWSTMPSCSCACQRLEIVQGINMPAPQARLAVPPYTPWPVVRTYASLHLLVRQLRLTSAKTSSVLRLSFPRWRFCKTSGIRNERCSGSDSMCPPQQGCVTGLYLLRGAWTSAGIMHISKL